MFPKYLVNWNDVYFVPEYSLYSRSLCLITMDLEATRSPHIRHCCRSKSSKLHGFTSCVVRRTPQISSILLQTSTVRNIHNTYLVFFPTQLKEKILSSSNRIMKPYNNIDLAHSGTILTMYQHSTIQHMVRNPCTPEKNRQTTKSQFGEPFGWRGGPLICISEGIKLWQEIHLPRGEDIAAPMTGFQHKKHPNLGN